MHVTAIIAAGGRGRRFGGPQPKQLLSVAGRPILERSVAAFLAHPAIDAVIVALPQDLVRRSAARISVRRQSRCASSPAAIGARIRWSNAFRAAEAASDIIVDSRRGAAVRQRGSHRADDCGGRGVGAPRSRRSDRATR